MPPGTAGAIRLHGRVLDGAGDPVPDALLELWQPGPDGAVVQQPGSLHRDGWTFTGWGRAATDNAGHWSFSTLRPGPGRPGAAPFFALTVFARGLLDRLRTRIYLPGDEAALAADPLLSGLPPERRATLVATAEPGGYAFDVVLQGARRDRVPGVAAVSPVPVARRRRRSAGAGRCCWSGPALGTSAATLWARCAAELAERLRGARLGPARARRVGAGDRPVHGRRAGRGRAARWPRAGRSSTRATRSAVRSALQLLLDHPGRRSRPDLHRREDRHPGELAGAGAATSSAGKCSTRSSISLRHCCFSTSGHGQATIWAVGGEQQSATIPGSSWTVRPSHQSASVVSYL